MTFTASCQRKHPPVIFTDRDEFEAHMLTEHRKRKDNRRDALAVGAPHAWRAPRAPKTPANLVEILFAYRVAPGGADHVDSYAIYIEEAA